MIYIVLGTMSETIKFSPVIREFKKRKVPFKVVHIGQNIGSVKLFQRLKLGSPDIVFKKSPREKWSKKGKIYSMLIGALWVLKTFVRLYKLFKKDKPDIVFYQGDCVSVPFTALAAKLNGCKTAHRESGLRSKNLLEPFPEEIDRIIGDFLGDFLFVPVEQAIENIKNYKNKTIIYTGEGQAENLKFCLSLKPTIKIPKKYLLVNIHRFENITSEQKMKVLTKVLNDTKLKVIFPLNLNTRKKLENLGLFSQISKNKNIEIIEPQDYVNFAHLMKNASVIITDSGGVQVESCILRVPCIVFRDRSEWKDALNSGFSILSQDPNKIRQKINEIIKKGSFYKDVKQNKCPYSGEPSKIIADILQDQG